VKSSLLRCVILIRTLRCLAPASVYTRWVELSYSVLDSRIKITDFRTLGVNGIVFCIVFDIYVD